MKPFNLKEAQAGAPVCTRDGRSARIICWDAKTRSNYQIIALIDSSHGEEMRTYTMRGEYVEGKNLLEDLCMTKNENHYSISNFKPFDKVLVRDNKSEKWFATFFSHYEKDKNMQYTAPFVTGCHAYFQCIPYNEETEHLVGSTEMPPKKYINW